MMELNNLKIIIELWTDNKGNPILVRSHQSDMPSEFFKQINIDKLNVSQKMIYNKFVNTVIKEQS